MTEGELEVIRAQIDGLDEEIVPLLVRRFELVKIIGHIKIQNGVSIMQEGRFCDVLDHVQQLAGEEGIEPTIIAKIYAAIHKEGLGVQAQQIGNVELVSSNGQSHGEQPQA
jgi:chorismate mutase